MSVASVSALFVECRCDLSDHWRHDADQNLVWAPFHAEKAAHCEKMDVAAGM